VSVTYPRGFAAAGVTAGVKPSGLPDLGLLVGDRGTSAAGLFTQNQVQAAPVRQARETLAKGRVRAVVVNSGQANAATGERGEDDARTVVVAAAQRLDLEVDQVVPCSTGVIGEPLHLDRLLEALPTAAAELTPEGGSSFARAIMTTDTVDKQAIAEIDGFRVGGAAKGVGMISPSLATMLAFVTTDAAVDPLDLRRLATEQLGPRFDALTVDGCQSTNDTVLLFASGAAGGEAGSGEPVRPGSMAWVRLSEAVASVGESLARQLIADGEGATRVLLVEVTGARADVDARTIAHAVADSPLVKAAAFGGDPNPGRILQAVGAAGVPVDPRTLDVWIGDARVARAGVIPPAYFEDGSGLAAGASLAMSAPEISIRVELGDGSGRSRVLGCALSYDYVRINGEYTT
jgi:glutamate N-acetyltransferase/amino-acid N-acetyltransferase